MNIKDDNRNSLKKSINYNNGRTACALCSRIQSHYSYGQVRNNTKNQAIMFIFDFYSPSQQNINIFSGQCGEMLKGLLEVLDLDKSDVIISVAVKCQSHKVEKMAELKAYHKQLLLEVKERRPYVTKIITFGKMAINCLINRTCSIKEIRQEPLKLSDDLTIYSTFSFFQALQDPNVFNDIVADVKKFLSGEKIEKDTEIFVNQLLIEQPKPLIKNNMFALDVETMGLSSFEPDKDLLSLSISFDEGVSFVYDVGHSERDENRTYQEFSPIFEMLESPSLTMIGHNIKFDYLWLKNKFDDEIKVKLCDTLTMFILLDENSQDNSLKYLASIHTSLPQFYNKGIDTSKLKELDFETLALYNGRDSDATIRLYNVLIEEIKAQGKENLLLFLNTALKTIAHIELAGIAVDKTWAEEKGIEIKKEYEAIETSYKMLYGDNFKLNSPKQLATILYDELKLPVIKKTAKDSQSTDKETLKILLEDHCVNDIQSKFLDDLLVYTTAHKLYSTYFEDLDSFVKVDGRVHASYNLGRNATSKGSKGTVTGRLSCSEPNMTNIPRDKRVKGIFVPKDGYIFLDADYSQLELRIGAWYSKEKKMYDLFINGEDIHTSVLSTIVKRPYKELVEILKDDKHPEYSKLKNTRVIAKSINFGIFYGAGANTIQAQARQAGLKITKQEAQEMINKWLLAYPKVARWIKNTQEIIKDKQEISSPTGRVRHLLGANRNDQLGFALLRQGVNFPIQTLASEVCLAGLIQIEKMLYEKNYDARMVLTVHDSVLIEYHAKTNGKDLENDVKSAMTSKVVEYFRSLFNFNLDIPLEVSITHAERWS